MGVDAPKTANNRYADPAARKFSEPLTEMIQLRERHNPAEAISPNTGQNATRTMTARDERTLIEQIQKGDRQAFERLLDAYETRVYRLALRYTDSVPDAEDVTQEIFLAIYRSIGSFRGQSALSTWIYRVAMNHCLEFRRKRKWETVPLNEELLLTSSDWRDDPVLSADHGELSERMEEAIRRLSHVHRDVILLHEFQGLTYQEVAAALDVPVGTVKSRLSNALRRLRELLGSYVYEGKAAL